MKMLHTKTSERYLYWFYLLGLSAYNPRNTLKEITSSKKSLPSICFLLITILSGVLSFGLFTKKEITLNDCLHAIYVILMVITGVSTFKRSSFLRGDTKYPWKYLINLELLISSRFEIDVDFKKYISAYARKLFCMLFVFGCYVSFEIFHEINERNVARNVGALILLLITLCVNFYMLFYIDLFNFIFGIINQHTLKCIDSTQMNHFIIDVKTPNLSDQILQLFERLKLIHLKLWKVTKAINREFGIILISIIIQNTNTAIQTVYWLVLDLYEDDLTKNIRIISTYCHGNISLNICSLFFSWGF